MQHPRDVVDARGRRRRPMTAASSTSHISAILRLIDSGILPVAPEHEPVGLDTDLTQGGD